MILDELHTQIALSEDSRRQFKRDITNADALAAESVIACPLTASP